MATFDFTEKNSKNGQKIAPKINTVYRRNGWNDRILFYKERIGTIIYL